MWVSRTCFTNNDVLVTATKLNVNLKSTSYIGTNQRTQPLSCMLEKNCQIPSSNSLNNCIMNSRFSAKLRQERTRISQASHLSRSSLDEAIRLFNSLNISGAISAEGRMLSLPYRCSNTSNISGDFLDPLYRDLWQTRCY